jgi:hypothetical protein
MAEVSPFDFGVSSNPALNSSALGDIMAGPVGAPAPQASNVQNPAGALSPSSPGVWASFFNAMNNNPALQQAFMSAGATMMQPSYGMADAFGKGVNAGLGTYNTAKGRQAASEAARRGESREERKLELDAESIEQRREAARLAAETQRGVAEGSRKTQEMRFAEELVDAAIRAGKAKPEERETLLAEQLKALNNLKLGKGQLTPNDALSRAYEMTGDILQREGVLKLYNEQGGRESGLGVESWLAKRMLDSSQELQRSFNPQQAAIEATGGEDPSWKRVAWRDFSRYQPQLQSREARAAFVQQLNESEYYQKNPQAKEFLLQKLVEVFGE